MFPVPDIIVTGGGPAGISAALTARSRGKTVEIIGAAPEDSPLYKSESIDNYPGFHDITGRELLEKMRDHASASGIGFQSGRVLSVTPMNGKFWISAGGELLESEAVVLAPGMIVKNIFPGEREFLGKGVSYCATCDGMLYKNKRVAVLGLCKEALNEAEFLKSVGCDVLYFEKPRNCRITGENKAEELYVDGTAYRADGVFILRSGVAPDNLVPEISLKDGHISVDEKMRTSLPGIFACGDCTGKPYQIAKAVGQGNVAGLSAAEYIEKKEK